MQQFLGKDGFVWFQGVVEDRNDPLMLGRVKVRCLGWHPEDKSQVSTDDLPWAYPMQPITSAAMNGIGTTPLGVVEGTWVFGFFRDGIGGQEPVIIGTIGGIPENGPVPNKGFSDPKGNYPRDEFLQEPDTNRLARHDNKIGDTIVKKKENDRVENVAMALDGDPWDQPDVPYDASYPYNHVYESESGHVQEFDDTPGHERIHTYHRSGTFDEMDADGSRVQRIVGDSYEIVDRNGYIYIMGKANVTVDGTVNIYVKNNVNLQVDGDLTGKVKNDVDLTVQGAMNLNVKESLKIKCEEFFLETTGGPVDIYSADIMTLESVAKMSLLSSSVLAATASQIYWNSSIAGDSAVKSGLPEAEGRVTTKEIDLPSKGVKVPGRTKKFFIQSDDTPGGADPKYTKEKGTDVGLFVPKEKYDKQGVKGTACNLTQQQFNAYRDYVAYRESRGRYNIVGGASNHYSGKYQLGKAAMIDAARKLGRSDYEDAINKDYEAFRTNVFLPNEKLQEEMFIAYTQQNAKYLAAQGIDCSTLKPEDAAGLLAAAHLTGAGTAAKLYKSGGKDASADAFGTRNIDYYKGARLAVMENSNKAISSTDTADGQPTKTATTDATGTKKNADTSNVKTGDLKNRKRIDPSTKLSTNFKLGHVSSGLSHPAKQFSQGRPIIIPTYPYVVIPQVGKQEWQIVANLRNLCEKIIEPLYEKYGAKLIITNAFRNINLSSSKNPNSQHLTGEAVDFQIVGYRTDMFDIAKEVQPLLSGKYDQFLLEYAGGGSWIHISSVGPYPKYARQNRGETLTYNNHKAIGSGFVQKG